MLLIGKYRNVSPNNLCILTSRVIIKFYFHEIAPHNVGIQNSPLVQSTLVKWGQFGGQRSSQGCQNDEKCQSLQSAQRNIEIFMKFKSGSRLQ